MDLHVQTSAVEILSRELSFDVGCDPSDVGPPKMKTRACLKSEMISTAISLYKNCWYFCRIP